MHWLLPSVIAFLCGGILSLAFASSYFRSRIKHLPPPEAAERRKVEEALRESEQNYRDLVEFSPVPVFVHRDGSFVYVNPAAVRLHAAASADDLVGKRLIDFVHPLEQEAYLQRLQEFLPPGDYRADELRIVRLDGEVLDLEATTMNVNYGGEPASLTICLDATERKSMVAELLKSESRYRGIVEDQTEFIVRWLPDGSRTFVNESYSRYHGASREELIGSNLFEEMEEAFRSDLRENTRRMTRENPVSTTRYKINRPDGSSAWHQWINRAIFSPDGRLVEIQSVGQDVTARMKAEEELRNHSELLHTILNTIPAPIFYKDEKGIYLGCNEAFERQIGLPKEKIVGHTVYDVAPRDLADIYREADNQLLSQGGAQFYETQVAFADGTRRDVIFNKAVFYKAGGEPGGLVGAMLDITERKKYEELVLNLAKESARTGQLAALGELAAGVAHEINNPIMGVINYAQILANKNAPGSQEHDIAVRIIREGDRIASIVSNLLSFARKGKTEKRPANLQEVLADALALIRSQLRKEGICLQIDLPIELPPVTVCPQQIQQVFLNILSNARHALNQKYPGNDDRKILEISWESAESGGLRYARILFVDHGCGIPQGIRDKIMNPFFTTKPQGEGTGLGLSISHEIIADHAGRMHIDSVEGLFTKVIVDLPIERKGN